MEHPMDKDSGFIYPIAKKVLGGKWWWSFSSVITKTGNRICIDTYVLSWLAVEVCLLFTHNLQPGWFSIAASFLVSYRLLDFILVTLHSLTRRRSDTPTWASRNRTFIMGFINMVEVLVSFAFLYGKLHKFPGKPEKCFAIQ